MLNFTRLLAACLSLAVWTSTAWAEKIVLVAGGGATTTEPTGAKDAKLKTPFGVDFDKAGTLFFVELEGQRVVAIDPAGTLTTIAGNGEKGNAGDGGPAKAATFNGMHSLAIAPDGDIYLADTWNNCVRKIDGRTHLITAFAGTGRKAFAGDGGPAASADFGGIYSVAFNPTASKMVLADLDNRRVRVVDMTSGIVTTVAGNGQRGVPADGSDAATSPLVDPRAAAIDRRGNVYVLERGGNALRVVDSGGKIRTLVGKGVQDCRDENGREPLALRGPKHLCIDLDDNVIIADTDNHMIRKYLPAEHKIIRLAGSGKVGAAGLGGPPLEVELNQPHGVYVHASGILYIADSHNHRLLKIEP